MNSNLQPSDRPNGDAPLLRAEAAEQPSALDAEIARLENDIKKVKHLRKLRAQLARERRLVEEPGIEQVLKLVMRAVTEQFGVSEEAVYSRRRYQPVADARQTVLYFLRQLTTLSTTRLGQFFTLDHGTVIHACQAVRDKCATAPVFAAKVAAVEAQLQVAGLINPSTNNQP